MEPTGKSEIPTALTLDSNLDHEIQAFAEGEQIPFDEAHGALLRLGLQVARGQTINKEDRLRDLEMRMSELGEALHLIGPAVLGVTRLLAHWAAQSGSVQVTEDELLAELEMVSQDQWGAKLSERGLVPPLPPLEPGETETFHFTADKSGVFSYYCTEFCSALHLEMTGYMLVAPRAQAQ